MSASTNQAISYVLSVAHRSGALRSAVARAALPLVERATAARAASAHTSRHAHPHTASRGFTSRFGERGNVFEPSMYGGDSSASFRRALLTTRTILPDADSANDPRAAAAYFHAEFENSSNSEEIVAAERGVEPMVSCDDAAVPANPGGEGGGDGPAGSNLAPNACHLTGAAAHPCPTDIAMHTKQQLGRDVNTALGGAKPLG